VRRRERMGLGSSSDIQLTSEEVHELQEGSSFTGYEIQRLFKRFRLIDRKQSGSITKQEFSLIPEFAMNPMFERIVDLFDARDVDGVNFVDFVNLLSQLHPDATLKSKLKLAFRCYDMDNDGKINEDDLSRVLRMLVGTNLTEPQVRFIAHKTINEADPGNGGDHIGFEAFCKVLQDRCDVSELMSIDLTALNEV
jgi:Ca2+-binding EF-hand superfamily protein